MPNQPLPAIQIPDGSTSVTTTVTAGSPTANVAVPNAGDGNNARVVLITADILVAYQPVQAAGAPALANMPRLQDNGSQIVNVAGFAEIRLNRVTADSNVTITPLDNQ